MPAASLTALGFGQYLIECGSGEFVLAGRADAFEIAETLKDYCQLQQRDERNQTRPLEVLHGCKRHTRALRQSFLGEVEIEAAGPEALHQSCPR